MAYASNGIYFFDADISTRTLKYGIFYFLFYVDEHKTCALPFLFNYWQDYTTAVLRTAGFISRK